MSPDKGWAGILDDGQDAVTAFCPIETAGRNEESAKLLAPFQFNKLSGLGQNTHNAGGATLITLR